VRLAVLAFASTSSHMNGGKMSEPRSPYILVEEVAKRLHVTPRTVHELTRTAAIPHRRLPGARRCLFREDELTAWENGAALEHVTQPRGGRIVRVRVTAGPSRS